MQWCILGSSGNNLEAGLSNGKDNKNSNYGTKKWNEQTEPTVESYFDLVVSMVLFDVLGQM